MDWLPNLLNQLVTVSNTVSSITSLLGFITLLATIIGYFITRRDGGFGSKYNKEVRYSKFFRFIAEGLLIRDTDLKPLRADVSGRFATCESTHSLRLRYRAHFFTSGGFGVYLNLEGDGAQEIFRVMEAEPRKRTLESQMGLDKRAGFFSRLFRRKQQSNRRECEPPTVNGGKGYRIVLYYPSRPDELSITSSGRKLKRVRRWALAQLVAFQHVFDQQVPEIRAELRTKSQGASATVDGVNVLVAAGQ